MAAHAPSHVVPDGRSVGDERRNNIVEVGDHHPKVHLVLRHPVSKIHVPLQRVGRVGRQLGSTEHVSPSDGKVWPVDEVAPRRLLRDGSELEQRCSTVVDTSGRVGEDKHRRLVDGHDISLAPGLCWDAFDAVGGRESVKGRVLGWHAHGNELCLGQSANSSTLHLAAREVGHARHGKTADRPGSRTYARAMVVVGSGP
jgi:hypothetical protein